MKHISPDCSSFDRNITSSVDVDATFDRRMVSSVATAKRQAQGDIGSPQRAPFEGCSATELVALASRAILTDPRSAKTYLDQAVMLLSVRNGAPAMDQVADLKKGTLTGWQMRKVNEYIQSNIGESIRTRDLADAARLSVSYFNRAFRITTGRSPHAFVVDKRLRLAKQLIARSGDPLSQIANACGFADQSHLSRIFKRRVGASPLSWRRAYEVLGASTETTLEL
jgi:AraC family transcriptional regulator